MLCRLPSTDLDLKALEIPDIVLHIFQYIEALQLCSRMSLVNSMWNTTAKKESVWHQHCQSLWTEKLYIVHIALNKRISSPRQAFKISYIDRNRNVISYDELTSIKWNFQTKYQSNYTRSNEIISCRFTKDFGLELPRFGGDFKWRFVKGRFSKWMNPEFYHQVNKHAQHAVNTNYGYTKTIKNIKSQSPFKQNILKQKFNNFGQNKVANSIKSGIQHLKQKLNKNNSSYPINEEHKVEENEDDISIQAPNGELNEGRYIQVNHYPPLWVFRDTNWGFILENRWVIFTSY